jgi:streptogramin lyase
MDSVKGARSILDAQGLGTILIDDTSVSVSDATATEDDNRVVFLNKLVPWGRAGLSTWAMGFGPDGDSDGMPDHLFTTSNRTGSDGGIGRFDARTGGDGEMFIANGIGGLRGPQDIVIGPDGHIYVSNSWASDGTGNDVLRFDVNTGAPLPAPGKDGATFVTSGLGGLSSPRGLAFDSDGNLYVANHDTSEVIRFKGPSSVSPGALIDVFVTAGSGDLFRPRAITFGPDGNLYVADMGNDQVLRYDGTDGTFIDDVVPTGSGGLDHPEDLKFAGGDLFVASFLTGEVLRYDGTTGVFIEVYVAVGSSGLSRPSGLLFTPQGNLLVGIGEVYLYGAASQAAFTVSLSHPVGRTVTVDLSTADDTATAGLDYTDIPAASPRTFTFAPGETSLSLLIPTLHDVLVEPSETFSVTLSNLSGASPGNLIGVGTILDDEPPLPPSPSFSISDVTVNEADGTATFTVTRSDDTSNTDTIDFATADGLSPDGAIDPDDYLSSSGRLTFDPGVASLPVQVTIVDDLVEESAETFFVNLSNSSIGTSISDAQGEGTILDNDASAAVQVTGISPASMSAGTTIFNVTITGSGFVAGAGVTFENFPGSTPMASNVVFVNANTITADVTVGSKGPKKNRLGDVRVTNPDGSTAACVGCFTVIVSSTSTTSSESSGPAQSLILSSSDETSTETTIIQPTDPTLLLIDSAWTEKKQDGESSTEEDPAVLPEDLANLDSLFVDLDGSLQDELLVV